MASSSEDSHGETRIGDQKENARQAEFAHKDDGNESLDDMIRRLEIKSPRASSANSTSTIGNDVISGPESDEISLSLTDGSSLDGKGSMRTLLETGSTEDSDSLSNVQNTPQIPQRPPPPSSKPILQDRSPRSISNQKESPPSNDSQTRTAKEMPSSSKVVIPASLNAADESANEDGDDDDDDDDDENDEDAINDRASSGTNLNASATSFYPAWYIRRKKRRAARKEKERQAKLKEREDRRKREKEKKIREFKEAQAQMDLAIQAKKKKREERSKKKSHHHHHRSKSQSAQEGSDRKREAKGTTDLKTSKSLKKTRKPNESSSHRKKSKKEESSSSSEGKLHPPNTGNHPYRSSGIPAHPPVVPGMSGPHYPPHSMGMPPAQYFVHHPAYPPYTMGHSHGIPPSAPAPAPPPPSSQPVPPPPPAEAAPPPRKSVHSKRSRSNKCDPLDRDEMIRIFDEAFHLTIRQQRMSYFWQKWMANKQHRRFHRERGGKERRRSSKASRRQSNASNTSKKQLMLLFSDILTIRIAADTLDRVVNTAKYGHEHPSSSKKYREPSTSERVKADYLMAISGRRHCQIVERGMPLSSLEKTHEAEIWYEALKLLYNFNFDYRHVDDSLRYPYINELKLVLRKYMAGHYERKRFLTAVIKNGFYSVILGIKQKLSKMMDENKNHPGKKERRKKERVTKKREVPVLAPDSVPAPTLTENDTEKKEEDIGHHHRGSFSPDFNECRYSPNVERRPWMISDDPINSSRYTQNDLSEFEGVCQAWHENDESDHPIPDDRKRDSSAVSPWIFPDLSRSPPDDKKVGSPDDDDDENGDDESDHSQMQAMMKGIVAGVFDGSDDGNEDPVNEPFLAENHRKSEPSDQIPSVFPSIWSTSIVGPSGLHFNSDSL